MTEKSNFTIRLSRAAREFNMGKDAIVKFLAVKGFQIDSAPVRANLQFARSEYKNL